MKYKDLIKYFGSISAASRRLGAQRSAIQRWRKMGYIPYKNQVMIEDVLDGDLVASKDDLIPDTDVDSPCDTYSFVYKKGREKSRPVSALYFSKEKPYQLTTIAMYIEEDDIIIHTNDCKNLKVISNK